MKRATILLVVIGLMMAAMAAPAGAARPGDDGDHKITICHATRSLSNPYVEITIDLSAWNDPTDPNHHGDHHTRTKDGITWKDYILPEGEECGLDIPPPPPPPTDCDDPRAITIDFAEGVKLVGPHPNPALENPTEPGLGSVDVPDGDYAVLLGSSDSRVITTEVQDHEQWRAVFNNGVTTNYSDDLLDGVLSPFVETYVGTYSFSGTISVTAEHWSVANPPPAGTKDPNSVIPEYVCLLGPQLDN